MKSKIFIFSLIISLFPLFATARGLVPCGGINEDPCTVKDVFVLVARVTSALIGLAGVYAVFELIRVGFDLVISMGNEEKITTQRKRIESVVLGFVLVLIAYMFVNTAVNYILLGGGKDKNCRLDLSDPLNYIKIHSDPANHAKCQR